MRDDVAGPRVPERESDEERYLYERLADLRRSYELAAKPYIERLVQIRSLRPAPSITLTPDQARELIDFAMGLTSVSPHAPDTAQRSNDDIR